MSHTAWKDAPIVARRPIGRAGATPVSYGAHINGRIYYKQRKINLSTVFAGQTVGIK